MNNGDPKALVILSGGQDSTTCLYWARQRFGAEFLHALTFDYGQRHTREIDCARSVAAIAGVAHTVLPMNTFAALGGNALTDASQAVAAPTDQALPNTFVPGRNLIFLAFAAAFAYPRHIDHLVLGVAQTDYSGYPDCRQESMEAMARALELGMERRFTLHTPLMHLSKRETVELAVRLGALQAMGHTHTCYNGLFPPCGACPACLLRAKGFAEAGVADPLLTRLPSGG